MDPVILHHGVSVSMAIGLIILTAAISFTAGIGFTRRYWEGSHQQTERAIETTE